MTPLLLLEYLAVVGLFLATVSGCVFFLCRRTEVAVGRTVNEYQSFIKESAEHHTALLNAQMQHSASLLELGSGMVGGMGSIVKTLSDSYSRDHVSQGLKLVGLLLASGGRVSSGTGDAGSGSLTPEAVERLLDSMTAPPPVEAPPSTINPEDL